MYKPIFNWIYQWFIFIKSDGVHCAPNVRMMSLKSLCEFFIREKLLNAKIHSAHPQWLSWDGHWVCTCTFVCFEYICMLDFYYHSIAYVLGRYIISQLPAYTLDFLYPLQSLELELSIVSRCALNNWPFINHKLAITKVSCYAGSRIMILINLFLGYLFFVLFSSLIDFASTQHGKTVNIFFLGVPSDYSDKNRRNFIWTRKKNNSILRTNKCFFFFEFINM